MRQYAVVNMIQKSIIEDVLFYHGTSGTAAATLLRGESVSWFHEDARALAADIVSVLLRHRSHLFETADLFEAAGVENGISAPLGLSQLVDHNEASSFSYGQLWLTTSFKMASEYALRNRHGSEAFAFLMDGLAVLDFVSDGDGAELLRKYPRLHRLSMRSHEPVVVAFCGLNCRDLQGQHGGTVTRTDVVQWLRDTPGVEFSPSYRLLRIEPEKIVRIHDLSNRTIPLPSLDSLGTAPDSWLSNKSI